MTCKNGIFDKIYVFFTLFFQFFFLLINGVFSYYFNPPI